MNSVSKSTGIINCNRSGSDIYDDVQEIAIEDITRQFENMIESSGTFNGWALSVKDSTRLIKVLSSRERIIKSSFKFQLKQNFSDFKSVPKIRVHQNITRDRHSLKLIGVDLAAEYKTLELIIVGCEESYSDFYALACQRLQHCVQRTHVSEAENPVHVKRLCEAFQCSLDALNLDSQFQIALYRLFSHFVIDNLGLTYEKIDQCLLSNNIQPDLHISAAESATLNPTTKAQIQIDSLTKKGKQDELEVTKKIASPVKTKLSETVKPKEQPEPQLCQNINKEPLPLEAINHAVQIQKGDWVKIIQNSRAKMAKVVWKSADCSLFIFVDNTGNRIRELNGDQLNKQIEDGSINLIANSSIGSNKANCSFVQPFMGQ